MQAGSFGTSSGLRRLARAVRRPAREGDGTIRPPCAQAMRRCPGRADPAGAVDCGAARYGMRNASLKVRSTCTVSPAPTSIGAGMKLPGLT